jgi:signal transduction histidine kinase
LNETRKYLLGLIAGLIVLPLLILLEIRILQDTKQQIWDAYYQTSDIVIQKEKRFNEIANIAIGDSLSLRKSWTDLADLSNTENASLFLFRNDSLVFWSRNESDAKRYLQVLDSGLHFLNVQNGSYLSFFKQIGSHKAVLLYSVKTNYNYQNQYIENHFNDELSFLGSALLSPSKLKDFEDVTDSKGNYLFSIQIFGAGKVTPFWLKLLITILILFCAWCFHFLIQKYSNKNMVVSTILFFALALSARWVFLQLKIPIFVYSLKLFSPDIYASSKVNPSLGDFMSLVFIFLWYFYLIRNVNLINPTSKVKQIIHLAFVSWLTITIADGAFDAIKSLVFDSQISFDINNIYALDSFTFLGLLLAVMILLLAYQMTLRLFKLIEKNGLSYPEKAIILGFVFYFLHPFLVRYLYERGLYFPIGSSTLVFTFIIFRAFVIQRVNRLQQYLIMVLVLSVFTSFFIYYWSFKKEQDNRILFAGKLTAQNDINTELFLKTAERRLKEDKYFKGYFNNPISLNSDLVKQLRPLYFNGYLSKYDVTIYDFDSSGNHYRTRNAYSYKQLNYAWKELSTPTLNSNFKYLGNNSFVKGYLSKFPVLKSGHLQGTIFIHLEPKLIQDENRFEELLIEGYRNMSSKKRSDYSYAIYRERQLMSQSGPYAYRTAYTFLEPENKPHHFVEEDGQDHLILKESNNIAIVITKPAAPWYEPFGLFSLSFTFFTIVLVFAISLFALFNNNWINKSKLLAKMPVFQILKSFINKLLFFDEADLSLLRTRIQLGIILIVFVTLASTAYFTIDLVKGQNDSKQSEKLLKKIRSVAAAIETEAQYGNLQVRRPEDIGSFLNQIADFYETEITLFNPRGEVISSTIRKLYDDAVLAPMINSEAFYHLNLLKESQFIQSERISTFSYTASYVPIHSKNKELIGYVQLPYFNRYADLYAEISSIIVGFINLYALLFIIIGALAWIYSRNISFPLVLIQQQMAQTTIGKKNEPIQWSRRDEIGELVIQYNQMIDQLEESAQKLAKSEREGAWRDIARQIAHEIKNPLTPMKLSIQHLERAWNDQSPKLPETFKRVTKTLITQIDSLSELATGFSSFAKMPAPNYEQIDVKDLVEQVVHLQEQYFDGKIEINVPDDTYVEFDKGYLNRSLVNLVKNATQAIPEEVGGLIQVMAFLKDDQLVIHVQDNGCGISSEQAEKIFTPYFSTKVIGMGLGLPIVKSMIESGGGTIDFESEPGKGTLFIIVLPAVQSA